MSDYTFVIWDDWTNSITYTDSGNTLLLTESARFAATIQGQDGACRNTVIVAGDVTQGTGTGGIDTIHLRTLGGVGENTVVVAETGSVFAIPTHTAIVLEGSGNLLQNFGQIIGGSGVFASDWHEGTIENHGSIVGMRETGVRLVTGSDDNHVLNTGTISGVGGIEMTNILAKIVNTGVILSNSAAVAAIDGAAAGPDGRFGPGFTVRNSGEIIGLGDAILGSIHPDRIVNAGMIEGDIRLGDGNDIYRGRLGVLDGVVYGDAGNDTLIGGVGDDRFLGGIGKDSLVGGAGDDTLSGGANIDEFVIARGGGGEDVVTDFVDNLDKLDLSAFHLKDFSAVAARATDVAGSLLISLSDLGGGSVLLEGMTKAQLDTGDVIL
jgi:Ca2+-binding RTX toxin-like protein